MEILYRGFHIFKKEGAITVLGEAIKHIESQYFNHAIYYYVMLVRSRIESDRTDPWSIIEIDPERIDWSNKERPYHGDAGGKVFDFHPIEDAGKIVGGSWDKRVQVRYTELPKYKAVRDHFIRGRSWEETGIFTHLSRIIEETGDFDGCENQQDLCERYRNIDRLYHQITEEGYKKRNELCRPYDYRCRLDVPKVHIARDGSFINASGSGNHRVAIARILEIPIEVRVVVRHRQWEQIRCEVVNSNSISSLSKKAKGNLNHPDISKKKVPVR